MIAAAFPVVDVVGLFAVLVVTLGVGWTILEVSSLHRGADRDAAKHQAKAQRLAAASAEASARATASSAPWYRPSPIIRWPAAARCAYCGGNPGRGRSCVSCGGS